MARLMARDAVLFEDRLNVFHEIDAPDGLEDDVGGPVRALRDPLPQRFDLRLRERFAFGRHHVVAGSREGGGLVKRAFLRLARNQRRAFAAARERAGPGIEAQIAFGLFRSVAIEAGRFENRFDVAEKIDWLGAADRAGRQDASRQAGGH